MRLVLNMFSSKKALLGALTTLMLIVGNGAMVRAEARRAAGDDAVYTAISDARRQLGGGFSSSSSSSSAVAAADVEASSQARNNSSRLVGIALKVALEVVKEARILARNCTSTWRKRNGPAGSELSLLERQAVEDCIALMASAKDQLDAAAANLSAVSSWDDSARREGVANLNVWLSASLSFQAACADGFAFVRAGKCQRSILGHQQRVSKAIVDGLSSVKKLGRRRRLLSTVLPAEKDVAQGFPEWLPPAARKLLLPASPAPAENPTPAINSPPAGPSVSPSPGALAADLVVAQDGSGDFLTISDALASIPPTSSARLPGERFTVYIKQGVYDEIVTVPKSLENLTFAGDGMGATVITGSNNVSSGLFNTLRTATVGISGNGFLARDITFRNTAGPTGYQAVALRASADYVVFYRCAFEGYQDTLYALSSRQFYKECRISGTVDFIFGNAIAIFQSCELVARRPLRGQQNTYTAQGRKVGVDVSGFSFQNCSVVGDPDLQAANYSVHTYMGRPWKDYSRTVFLQSFMDELVHPDGWLPWNSSNPFTDTVYYGEYGNRGPGSRIDQRVAWVGVHPNMSASDANPFTADNFIVGSTWLPSMQVAYTSGLDQP